MRPITRGMKRWACLLLLVLAAAAGCSSPSVRLTLPPSLRAQTAFVTVRIAEQSNAIRRVPLEEYVAGTILSEVAPPSGDERLIEQMHEVQAVVARTYAMASRGRHAGDGFDLCSTTHCQLYEPSRLQTSRWAASARTAAAQTSGMVLWHKQAPVTALFHADCGGHTSTAVNVWGGSARPYITARPDDDVEGVVHSAWRYEVPAADLLRALNADARMGVGRRIDTLQVVDRDVSGRADTVSLHGERDRLVRAEDLRARLTRAFGARTIRSTMFTVRRERATFVFEGRGFGHGVGLCQAGAIARLKAGVALRDVLLRYFPQTTLHTLGD
jgi:stage II sporulation protein D (peptidoglycan lytic transglycosylase)